MQSRDYVQSLERGLAILLTFDADAPIQTLSQVAQRAGLTRAAARRFLLTLVELGYIGTDGKGFWLLPRVLDLGHRYLSGQAWWQLALPVMEEMAGRLKESCSICVLEGHEVVYVAHFAASRFLSINLSVGSRLPAYPTALGRVLLAQLPPLELAALVSSLQLTKLTPNTVLDKRRLIKVIEQSRKDGYSLVDQELEIGLMALAVPIGPSADVAFAAMGVSVPAARAGRRELVSRFLPVLLEGKERIAAGLALGKR